MKSHGSILTVRFAAILIAVLSSSPALAWKKGGGNGGGGKPGGGSGYSVIELDSLPGTAYGNRGDVVVGEAGDQAHCWIYDPVEQAATPSMLDHPNGISFDKSRATDINGNGAIAGVGWLGSSEGLEGVPLVWLDRNQAAIVLPTPEDTVNGAATAVNDAGIVVGVAHSATTQRAVAWRLHADGTVEGPVELATGDLALGHTASAQDLNYAGHAVGWVQDRAVRWRLDWAQGLTLVGRDDLFYPPDVPYSRAHAINAAGDICGQLNVNPAVALNQAFLLKSGQPVSLRPLVDNPTTGTDNVNAVALNDADASHGVQVVGHAQVYDRASDAGLYDSIVLWEDDDSVTDLTSFGSRKTSPEIVRGIDNSGRVTGATFNSRRGHSVPMLMVPK